MTFRRCVLFAVVLLIVAGCASTQEGDDEVKRSWEKPLVVLPGRSIAIGPLSAARLRRWPPRSRLMRSRSGP